jgi:hypothetical protein
LTISASSETEINPAVKPAVPPLLMTTVTWAFAGTLKVSSLCPSSRMQ